MFDLKNFKSLTDKTTKLIEEFKETDKDKKEEIEVKIESNVFALKHLASKIEDPETRCDFLTIIENLKKGVSIRELEESISIKRKSSSQNKSTESKQGATDLIDNEMLKNTYILKKMAEDFNVSLKNDKKVLDRLNVKMGVQSIQSEDNLKKLEKKTTSIKSSFFLFISLIIFFVIYFIIRFF